MVFNPSFPPFNRIMTKIFSFSLAANATESGEAFEAEIEAWPSIMPPAPAKPNA
jgi:hypothetical protein